MEKADDNLFNMIFNAKKLNDEFICDVMAQIAAGLQILHKHQTPHGNLKASNVLVVRQQAKNVYKISDYGNLQQVQSNQQMLYIKAPETLIAGELGCESDMWQLGLLCYQLMTSENLFTGRTEYQVMSAIRAGYD